MTTIPAPATVPKAPATLLLTRPQPASEAFVTVLGAWPGSIIISPILRIEAVTGLAPPSAPASLIFTSKHAVAFYSGALEGRAFCVGEATTQAARSRGFDAVCVAADALGLIEVLPGLDPPQPLCHVRGHHVAQPVAAALGDKGLICTEWLVYDQVAQELSAQADQALSGTVSVIAPVFSPRSADLLGRAVAARTRTAPCHFVSMSARVTAQIIKHIPKAHILQASAPNAKAMANAVHASARHVRALEGKPPLA